MASRNRSAENPTKARPAPLSRNGAKSLDPREKRGAQMRPAQRQENGDYRQNEFKSNRSDT